jgi:formylglycine-generating enzyme required for sulfatase activity
MSAEELKYFFSYTSKDREFVLRLAKELRAVRVNLWMDHLDIRTGQHWDREVEKALKNCKGMIAVLSPDSVASDNVMDEVSYALDEGKLVVSVIMHPCDIPLRLRRVHYADLTTDYDAGFSQLLRALGIEESAQPPESTPGKKPVVQDSTVPLEAKPTESPVHEQQAAQHAGEPSSPEVPGPAADVPDLPKSAGPESDRATNKGRMTKVLSAICVVALITVVLIGVFLQPEDKSVTASFAPKAGNVVTNSIGMKLVYIPAGSFMMGSGGSAAELAREYVAVEADFAVEFPQHEVHISKGFWMGQTEVTQGQYKSVMNAQPWSEKDYVQEDANNPAVCVSWDDAVEFSRKLSEQTGETYRLPTEAEWEYACRAGTKTRFSFGDSDSSLGDYAWFKGNTYDVDEAYAHSVGQRKPNPWGIYDMHGNVWEWCLDWYAADYYSNSPESNPEGPDEGSRRVCRGGGWGDWPRFCRSAYRTRLTPSVRFNDFLGFRVARSFVGK